MKNREIERLILVCAVLAAVCGCNKQATREVNPQAAAVKTAEGWLVGRDTAEAADLKIVWQFNLPMTGGESLDKLYVFGSRLYALSNRNYLSCLNRADGNVVFSESIAEAGLPLLGMEYFNDELITMVGSRIVEISTETGSRTAATNIATGAACPVVRNDEYFYVAGLDRRLYALNAGNKVVAFKAAAENDSLITAVMAAANFVIFATDKGNVVCISHDRPFKLWQFDAPAAIVGQLVRDNDSIYFACRDTNIYRLNILTGELLWKHQVPAIVDLPPQVGAAAVYQDVPGVGLIAMDKQTGKQIWQVNDGIGLAAESGNKAFVIAAAGRLVVMDNAKAKQLYTVEIGKPVRFAFNSSDSKIYIGDTHGRLACLEPVQ